MQKLEAFEDLPAPRDEDSRFDLFEPLQIGLQGAGSHELGDQDNAFSVGGLLFADLPRVVKANDVGMLQSLEHFGFLSKSLSLNFGQLSFLL